MTARRPGDRRPPPGLSADDLELWRRATRGDRPLAGRDGRAQIDQPPPAPARRAERAPPSLPPLAVAPAAGLDKRTAQRLRRGLLPVEARLDLHGKTRAEAHAALDRFLARAQAAGRRCVLVITGKGTRAAAEAEAEVAGAREPAAGVLRQAVPRWLDEPRLRARVIAIAPARPQHGGDGALYVLLRKPR